MSFAKSFYADQKKVEQQPQQQSDSVASAAIPATTPIAEDSLTPAQIQEAIRIYRSVLSSNSAPSSPVRRPVQEVPEKPQVHSNYYGGGPTDIPQSYLLNYSTTSPARAQPVSAPTTQAPEQMYTEQQLMEKLQALQLQQAAPTPEPVHEAPKKAFQKKAPVLQKMYDDEESGYCFARKDKEEEQEEIPEAHVATPTKAPVQQANYSAPVANNSSEFVSVTSEYIGMANDNKFIYDAQQALPASYTQNNSYTMVNSAPVAPIKAQEQEENGMTIEEGDYMPFLLAMTNFLLKKSSPSGPSRPRWTGWENFKKMQKRKDPIAEDPLTPAQIQEAIRIYRSVLSSNSAPSSPVRCLAQEVPERPQVHSNYYGGGPTDIPQSYLLNYSTTSPARAQPVVCEPSEYIGMANDNKFIYDAQQALPASYTQNNSYTMVNSAPVAPIKAQDQQENGMTIENITQVPESPAVTSRFRGLIRNAQTPIQSTDPIVAESIAAEPVNQVAPQHNYNNYGAFMPVNQMSMESEYQFPALND